MSNTLVMLGAGGHAKVCYEIAVLMDKWEKIIVLDDNPHNDFFEISGSIDSFTEYKNAEFFVAIGDNQIREKFINKLEQNSLATLIHPSAIVGPSVIINKGTVIMAGAVINADTIIGAGCIINTGVTIDHDNKLNKLVHVSPGAHLAGNVSVGEYTWIGMGTNVINKISISENVIIGAGATVTKDIPANCTAVGTPAKPIKYHK